MKKLIFVRHGRAEKDTPGISDFERSLTADGKNTSEEMAMILNEKIQDPVILITSPAFRAYETAMIFVRILGYDTDQVILKNNLYHPATLNSFAEVIEPQDNNIDTIILFGHNPSFTEIPDRLSRNGCDFLPKCGIVCLSFKTDKWKGIVRERGNIEFFLKPQRKV
jgi:phosphohistidine phosphatase